MADTASSVPPFIPGLLIVGLLIVISVLIAYRNYVRRGNSRLMPGIGDWPFWNEEGIGEGTGRPEKPKIWEVDVISRNQSGKCVEKWECIMPLSATPLTPESTSDETSSTSDSSRNQTTISPALNSRMHHINLFSAPSRSEVSPPPLHQLQVSVLISMPSPRYPRWHQSRSNIDTKSEKSPEDLAPSLVWRQSTSSSIHEDKKGDIEGIPEVALGVTVMPWRVGLSNEGSECGGTGVSSG